MKQAEAKEKVIESLEKHLDPALKEYGFSRPPKGLVYSRKIGDSKCEFYLDLNRRSLHSSDDLCYLCPLLWIRSKTISERAVQLAGDTAHFRGAHDVLQNAPLTIVSGSERSGWYVTNIKQLPKALREILKVFLKDGLPFLKDYSTASSMIEQHEAGDERPLRTLHFYIYVISAYLIENKQEAAKELLRERFSKLGIKRQFEELWNNVESEEGN